MLCSIWFLPLWGLIHWNAMSSVHKTLIYVYFFLNLLHLLWCNLQRSIHVTAVALIRCLNLGIYPFQTILVEDLSLFLATVLPGLCGHRFHGKKTDTEIINQQNVLTDMRPAYGKSLRTQTLKLNVGLWDLRAYLNLAKISDSVNVNSHSLHVCSLCITSANTGLYNWLKEEIHFATPTSFCSLGDFPPEQLAALFLSCEEVTAPCWPWFPLLNRCWPYFILQMRHFMNYHESKELLELRGRGWNGKKGKEGKEKIPKHQKSHASVLCCCIIFFLFFCYFKIPTSMLPSLKPAPWKWRVRFKDCVQYNSLCLAWRNTCWVERKKGI